METLAVMIVTSCVIPILVVIFFVWVAKIITGVNFIPDLMSPGGLSKLYRRRRKPEPEAEAAE